MMRVTGAIAGRISVKADFVAHNLGLWTPGGGRIVSSDASRI